MGDVLSPDRTGRAGLRPAESRGGRGQDRLRRTDAGGLPRADADHPQNRPIGNLLGMLPGAGQMKEALAAVDDSHLDRLQAIIRGMTPEERADPKIINASRRLRIANGSGVSVSEVNQLVDRFFEARKMMSQMAGAMGMPFGRRSSKKNAKNKKGQEGRSGTHAAEGPQSAARWRIAGGFPDLSQMPEGLNELPPGLADFDLSKLNSPARTSLDVAPLHVRGRGLPDGEPVEWWIADGDPAAANRSPAPRRSSGRRLDHPRSGRRTLPRRPGGARRRPPRRGDRPGPRPNVVSAPRCCATADRPPTPAASTTVTTFPGSSARASTWPGRGVNGRGFAIELEDEWQLPEALAEQARRGDGWVKLVGDWIDRSAGDLAPLWSDEVLRAADRRRACRGRPGHRARVQRGRTAGSDRGRHRLHRTRHRPDR